MKEESAYEKIERLQKLKKNALKNADVQRKKELAAKHPRVRASFWEQAARDYQLEIAEVKKTILEANSVNHIRVNTLVQHKIIDFGIGCVSKVGKRYCTVNFGLHDVKKCMLTELNIINTDKCSTVTFHEFSHRILKHKSTLNKCIVGNELWEYTGIGWTAERVITTEDLKKYPRVIN